MSEVDSASVRSSCIEAYHSQRDLLSAPRGGTHRIRFNVPRGAFTQCQLELVFQSRILLLEMLDRFPELSDRTAEDA